MPHSSESKSRCLNPLIAIYMLAMSSYAIFCIYWDSATTRNTGFADYLSMLFYPIAYPIHSIQLYYERLREPYTGHVWGWFFFACIVLAFALLSTVFASIFAKDVTVRKWSVAVGIPLALVWLIGVVLIFLSNAMG